jgi:Phage tail protein (Tail_P2_I)
MTDPDFTPMGARLRERTIHLQPDDAKYNYAHSHLCEGMMRGQAQVAQLVDPSEPYPPWSPLFNVELCPDWALPWLAQVVGVRMIGGLDAQGQRDFIRDLAFARRGSPKAIRTLIASQLSGGKMVWFRERDNGDPYRLEAIVRESEVITSVQEIQDLVIAHQKPGGIIFVLRTTTTWDYQEMTTDYVGRTYADIPGDYPKYSDLTGGPLA